MSTSAQFPECTICFEYLESDLSTPIGCGHIFHSNCLKEWVTKNRHQCPVCRGDATKILKLIYNVKYAIPDINNDEGGMPMDIVKSSDEIIQENLTLQKEKKILLEQRKDMIDRYENFNKELEDIIKKQEGYLKREEEHKWTIKSQKLKLDQKDAEISALKEENEVKSGIIADLNNAKKNFELQMKTIKSVDELKNEAINDQNEIMDIKDRLIDMMNRNDGGASLSEYVYILEQKAKRLEQENQDLKRKNYELQGSQDIYSRTGALFWKTSNFKNTSEPVYQQKKTFNEYSAQKMQVANENNKSSENFGGTNRNNNKNTTKLNMPYNMMNNGKLKASFLKK